MLTLLAMCVSLFLLTTIAPATEVRTPEAQAIAQWVDGLAARVGHDGLNDTLRATTTRDWYRAELGLYVFVFETNGTLRAHPEGRMIGHDISSTAGARGRPFIRDILAALPESGDTVWISYSWWDPKEKRVRPKRTYARRVGLLVLACGYYLEET